MRIPRRRARARTPDGQFSAWLLIVSVAAVAVTIVIVTGSTSGFTNLVTLLMALAAVLGGKLGKHRGRR